MTFDADWIPKKFKDLISNGSCVNYSDLMKKIMAVDLRNIVLFWGDEIIKSIRKKNLSPDESLKILLNRLVKYYCDPLQNELKILNIKKELASQYKCLTNEIIGE